MQWSDFWDQTYNLATEIKVIDIKGVKLGLKQIIIEQRLCRLQ